MKPPAALSGNEVEVKFPLRLTKRIVERVGLGYLNAKKRNHGTHIENSIDSADKLNDDDIHIAVDIDYLRSLNPKEWKDQDHYAVLGLEKQRIEAAEDDIRRAYRRMVLLHHPDKRKAKGEEVDTDKDYFTCITKAYEILGSTKTRRAYDSVDPEFDDNLPTQSEIDKNYFEVFNKYFTLNARWSERKDVPPFGDYNALRADVDRFYSFWYDFKSWREFSYMDEEDKEKGQDRDERRWIEKENKVARIKRKKEEMQRIRTLVDLAYNNDKRIQKFKNEEKEKKLAAKRAKMDAAQAQKAEQERVVREAQLAKEKADKAEQKRIELIRIEKEQLKKAVKKERKLLRDKAKECKYFCADDNDKNLIKHMEGVEKICETYNLQEMQELNKRMLDAASKQAATDIFHVTMKAVDKKLSAATEDAANTEANAKRSTAGANDVKEVKKSELWSNESVQLLIKAVNLFPAGTSQRWDVIASFINQHCAAANLTARDVLNKAKALQNSDFSKNSLKTQANQAAFECFEKSNKKDVQTCNDITMSDDMSTKENNAAAVNHKKTNPVAAMNGHCGGDTKKTTNKTPVNANDKGTEAPAAATPSAPAPTPTNAAPAPAAATPAAAAAPAPKQSKQWTKEEQALLEQAIKTYPISTPDRWDRIAECIPNRTKKDCLRRVKELVELVNSKNKAQQAVK